MRQISPPNQPIWTKSLMNSSKKMSLLNRELLNYLRGLRNNRILTNLKCKLMKKHYIFLVAILMMTTVFAQNQVTINVTDSGSNPVDNAEVNFNSSTETTDVNGTAVFSNVPDGLISYTINKTCYEEATGSITVAGGDVTETVVIQDLTAAPVFVSTSSNPIIGAWVDGDITISNADNSYSYSVTEFDNIVADVAFGQYEWSFVRSGGCYPEVTGSVTVDCDAISPQSGNIFLSVVADQPEITELDTSVEQADNVLTANAQGVSYQWINCDTNQPIDGATEQIFTATEDGSYAVIVTLEACALSNTSECFEVNSLSQTEFDRGLIFSVYPNPVNDRLNIQFNSSYNQVDLMIYSMEGKLMNHIKYDQMTDTTVDLSSLSSGTYILNIVADGKKQTELIIKN